MYVGERGCLDFNDVDGAGATKSLLSLFGECGGVTEVESPLWYFEPRIPNVLGH